MSTLSETRPNRWWTGALGRRRLFTGAVAAGAAVVAEQLVTDQPGVAAAGRTNLNYYWEQQQTELGYSQAIKVGDTVWLSGTASLDHDFVPVYPNDLGAQMTFVYARIRETLAKFSLGFRHVVRENMYVTDMTALLPALPYRKSIYGNGPFPTSTTIQVSQLLLPGLMIEIEITASA
jgi:2-iminobutanoate/2-iminopropanoate deaminase